MSAPASLLDHWYALGPEDKPFRANDPDWGIFRVVEDDPDVPTVTIENAGGERFPITRDLARAVVRPPSDLKRTDL